MTRARILISLAAAAGLALAGVANAQNQRSANAGEIRDIKYASGSVGTAVVYAASQGGGVFKSTNSGLNWAKTGLNKGYVWSLAISDVSPTTRVYAATDAGLFRTDDSGATWIQLTFDPARAVAVDPGSGAADRVLLGVPGQGVLRSTDNGASWTRQSDTLNSTEVTHIVFQSAGVAYIALDCNYQDLLGTFGEGNWGGVYRTSNAANTPISWTDFSNGGGGGTTLGKPPNCIRALAANAGTVFVGTNDPFGASGRIYRSTGTGWVAPAAASPNDGDLFGVESLAIDRNNSNTIHGGARSIAVWTSTGGGATGTYVRKVDPTSTESPDVHTKIYAMETIPGQAGTMLVAAKGLGIMRSANFTNAPSSAIDWDVAAGITADRVRGLANHATNASNTYWMALEQGGVAKSTNAGSTWAPVIAGMDFGGTLGSFDMILSATAIAADPVNTGDGSVLVGTRGGGLLASASGGTAWTTAGLPGTVVVGGIDHKPQSLLIPSTNLVYYSLFDAPGGGRGGGLMRSSTGPSGLAQTVYPGDIVSCAIPVGAGGSGYRVIQAAGNVAYFLRYDGLPYRSTDNFASNTAGCVTAPETGFERLFFHDIAQNPNATSTLVGATNKGVYRSTDNGLNWSRVTLTAPAGFHQVLSGLAYIGSNLFGISRAGGLYCSTDNGGTWQAKSLGSLPPVAFRELKVLNGALHILTDGGGVYNGFAATCP